MAAVGVTAQLTVREADGHLQATREAAALISARMKPGDAIVYSTRDSGAGVYGTSDRVGRDLVAHYIPADRRPADVLQVVPQRTAGRVTAVECTNVASCLRGRQAGLGPAPRAPDRPAAEPRAAPRGPSSAAGTTCPRCGTRAA